jgi:hypothetical protein
MKEAESFKFSLGVQGEDQSGPGRITGKTGFYRYDSPNLEDIIQFLKNKNLTPENEEKLIKLAKNTPHGSLANFRKNYKIYLKK